LARPVQYIADSGLINRKFGCPTLLDSGVWWIPTDYKPMDQTPYLVYLDEHEDKTRAIQLELEK
jgi:hypothetical protein